MLTWSIWPFFRLHVLKGPWHIMWKWFWFEHLFSTVYYQYIYKVSLCLLILNWNNYKKKTSQIVSEMVMIQLNCAWPTFSRCFLCDVEPLIWASKLVFNHDNKYTIYLIHLEILCSYMRELIWWQMKNKYLVFISKR